MARKTTKLVAEICLYGNRETGAGWMARLADGIILGNGEPREGRSCTEAVWMACDAIRHAFENQAYGHVRIFSPNGKLMASTDVNHADYYGNLQWVPAVGYSVSVEDILAAAE